MDVVIPVLIKFTGNIYAPNNALKLIEKLGISAVK
jgi:hypothetical protein